MAGKNRRGRQRRILREDRKELLERTLGWKERFGEEREEPEENGRGQERTPVKNLWLERTLLKEPLGRTERNQRKEPERTLG